MLTLKNLVCILFVLLMTTSAYGLGNKASKEEWVLITFTTFSYNSAYYPGGKTIKDVSPKPYKSEGACEIHRKAIYAGEAWRGYERISIQAYCRKKSVLIKSK